MIHFIKLKEEHLEQVLTWRTKEDVTRYMNTDIAYDLDKQRQWFEQVSASETDKYWIISVREKPIGLISLNEIDVVNKRTSWGYYIGEEKERMYGAVIPRYLYHYVFTELNLHKIMAEVMKENINVIKLNKLHGCRKVGVFRDHIYKNGKFHDIMFMELLKKDWEKNEKNFNYKASFEE